MNEKERRKEERKNGWEIESWGIELGTFSLEDHYFYHQAIVFQANFFLLKPVFFFSSPGEPLFIMCIMNNLMPNPLNIHPYQIWFSLDKPWGIESCPTNKHTNFIILAKNKLWWAVVTKMSALKTVVDFKTKLNM